MELFDFFEDVKNANIDYQKVKNVEMKYDATLSKIGKGIISIAEESLFIGDYRVISYSEIMNAEEDLHVCFSEAGLIPFVDCMDNDFIVYDFRNKVWTMFNIVEKCKFGISGELEQIMK